MSSEPEYSQKFLQRYDQFAPRVAAFVYSRLNWRNVAASDDLCQEIWLRVHEKCPPEIAETEFPAWLFTVARNLVVDHHKKKRAATHPDVEGVATQSDPAAQVMQVEEEQLKYQWLADCIAALDERRRAVMRGWLACMSMIDICQPLGISADRGYKLNHEAKKQVKACVLSRSKEGLA